MWCTVTPGNEMWTIFQPAGLGQKKVELHITGSVSNPQLFESKSWAFNDFQWLTYPLVI